MIATPLFNIEGSTVLELAQSGTTDDKFNAFIIWFEGDPADEPATTVSGNIVTFKLGGTSGTADTSVNTTGAINFETDGVDSPTLGEIAALVNASTTGWKMQLCSGFTGDVTFATAILVVLSSLNNATYANQYAVGVNWDVSALAAYNSFAAGRGCIGPEAMGWLLGGARRSQIVMRPMDANPAQEDFSIVWQPNNWQNALGTFIGTVGNAGSDATGILTVYSADQNDTISTATLLYTDGGFTDDTARTLGSDSLLAISKPGQRLVLRLTGDAALNAIAMTATGYCDPSPKLSSGSAS